MEEELPFTDFVINQLIQTKQFISEQNIFCVIWKGLNWFGKERECGIFWYCHYSALEFYTTTPQQYP
jgi:hypothetical protein